MSKLSPAKSEEIIKVLKKLGFERIRQSGSHAIFYHTDGRWTTVPIHKGKDVAKGTLHKILKDAGLSYEEFLKLK
ncbi:MAG: type II toxin-antitoxin system HicA family toxin [wastewater metagenome]|nr:type II toxin-antitoxin system HicA family toxin [Candidatus Loosdrechtia aerotolerans]